MAILEYPEASKVVYPYNRFGKFDNYRRITNYNKNELQDYTHRNVFNLENTNLLVGILQQLSIDPSWDLEQVIEYTKFKENLLATPFHVVSVHGRGEPIKDGFFKQGVSEWWCLIDNQKTYHEDLIIQDNLRPVIPLYSTLKQYGYKHPYSFPRGDLYKGSEYAIIGLDMVELAVGWWKYQRSNPEKNTGPAAYLCQFPLVTAKLIHNQLVTINILYDFFVTGKVLESLFQYDTVNFTTIAEDKLRLEYFKWLVQWLTERRLINVEHFLGQLQSIYFQSYFNYIQPGKYELFSQTQWIWEIPVLKVYAIYLTLANNYKDKYKANDINTAIQRTHMHRMNHLRNLNNADAFKEHLLALSQEVFDLNEINLMK